jgi:hypothetical protein
LKTQTVHKTDFCGWDGEITIGRIRFEPHGPKKGLWHSSALGAEVRERLLPHQGYEETARKAAWMVEDYYERLRTHNGKKEREA